MEAEAVNETNPNISTTSTGKKKMHVIVPKRTLIKNRIHCEDGPFIEFLRKKTKVQDIDVNNHEILTIERMIKQIQPYCVFFKNDLDEADVDITHASPSNLASLITLSSIFII